MSLLHIFRDSVARRDARQGARDYVEGERDLTRVSQKRREGAGEDALRRNLARDLESLLNTIRLDVAVPLDDHPRVAASIVNFGLQDMDSLWRGNRTPTALAEAIRLSLIRAEPRLRAETLEVRVADTEPSIDQRLSLEVSAEMISDPTDIAMHFVAEIDPAAGKITMGRMQGVT